MGFFATLITTPLHLTATLRGNRTVVSKQLVENAQKDLASVFEQLNTSPNGLTAREAASRLETYGANEIAREKRDTW